MLLGEAMDWYQNQLTNDQRKLPRHDTLEMGKGASRASLMAGGVPDGGVGALASTPAEQSIDMNSRKTNILLIGWISGIYLLILLLLYRQVTENLLGIHEHVLIGILNNNNIFHLQNMLTYVQ